VLNAGVSGDRTENLLWRMQHGNLAGPLPVGLIVMIGTNDLTSGGHPRPPALVAEGIRANLLYLRTHVPNARMLLLGLYPREDVPRLRPRIPEVNRLIESCGDGRSVIYADIGGVLLEPDGQLSRAVSPDLLHFGRLGYERLAPRLNPLIDNLLAGR
jgi:lysophospholipase L1-like esterase